MNKRFTFLTLAVVFCPSFAWSGAPYDRQIGGGKFYVDADPANKFTSGDIGVDTATELHSALAALASAGGGVVFIEDDIDLTNETGPILIPTGITLAGDRGNNGSQGPLLWRSTHKSWPLIEINGSDVRLSGFRIRGPHDLILAGGEFNTGVRSTGHADLEIDNMELFNWSFAAVRLNGGTVNARIHHSSIHDNLHTNIGYGVVLYEDARAEIDHNLFNSNRHSVAGSGEPGQAYEASSNIVFGHANSHAFDMHGYREKAGAPANSPLAGDYVKISGNTFLLGSPGVQIRGVPKNGALIENNSFIHSGEDQAIRQWIYDPNGDRFAYPYTPTFVVTNSNTYETTHNLAYTDMGGQVSGLANDVFWAVPEPTAANSGNKTWYVSYDGIEPWHQLQNSGADFDKLRLGDFEGTGVDDVFKADGSNWQVSKDATASWQQWNNTTVEAGDLTFGDFDGDMKVDVAHIDWADISYGGNSQWSSDVIHSDVHSTDADLFAIDIGLDLTTDILRVHNGGFEVSRGSLTSFVTFSGNRGFVDSDVVYGDFNGDGKTDQFRTASGVWQVMYHGSLGFQPVSMNHSETLSELGFGDFDGDGQTDVFRRGPNNKWEYWSFDNNYWHGDGMQSSGIQISEFAFGDFNGDGLTDVFRIAGSQWQVSWSARSSWVKLNISAAALPTLAFADFDGDGRTDVARVAGDHVDVSLSGSQRWFRWSPK